MDILTYLKEKPLLLDGAMGSLLLARGMKRTERSESWNLSHGEVVREIHRSYFDAGSNVVLTNTFGANGLFHDEAELRQIVTAAVGHARAAAESSGAPQEKFVALDIGPCGQLVAPLGEMSPEKARELFAQVVRFGAEAGADLVFIETMYDLTETVSALEAAKANCPLPVFVSNNYSGQGTLMTGADPKEVVARLSDLSADAVGMNCSMGAEGLAPLAEEYLRLTDLPVIFKPNAGLPEIVDGVAVYKTTPETFAQQTAAVARKGVRCVGGCCGTTPAHIAALAKALAQNEI